MENNRNICHIITKDQCEGVILLAKKIVTIALGILCVGLLTVILYSVITGWNVSLLPAENSAVSSVSPSSAMPKPGSSGKNEPSSKPAAPSKPEPEPSRAP